MNGEQKGVSSPLAMISVSAKQEPHNQCRSNVSEKQSPPAKTSISAIEARPLQSLPPSSTKAVGNGGVEEEEKKRDKEHKRRSKNWTRVETLKLIRFRSEMEPRFLRSSRKSELWDEISEGLRSDGICRDGQQCRDKWEKLTAGYKEVRDGVREKEDYPFYDDLDPLLSGKAQRRETQTQAHRIELQQRGIEMEIGGRDKAFVQSEGEDTEDGGEYPRRKRRKSVNMRCGEAPMEALKDLLESLLARQQHLFVDLLESIEQREKIREKIRQEREEKWRKEDRAQRVAFQNAMIVLMKKLVNEGVRCATDSSTPVAGEAASSLAAAETGMVMVGGSGGGGGVRGGMKRRSKNWKRAEVLQLIKLRTEMESRFAKSTRRAVLWEEVAEMMGVEGVGVGVGRDGKQCREKWDKLMAEYKEVSEGKRERGDSLYYGDMVGVVTRVSSSSFRPPPDEDDDDDCVD